MSEWTKGAGVDAVMVVDVKVAVKVEVVEQLS